MNPNLYSVDREQRLSAILHDVAALHLGTEKVLVQVGLDLNKLTVCIRHKDKLVTETFRGVTQAELLNATRFGFQKMLHDNWPRIQSQHVGSLP